MADDLINQINSQNENVLFDLELKTFKEANEISRELAEQVPVNELEIFNLSKELWHRYTNGSTTSDIIPYKLDGLIYTPQEKPVGWTPILYSKYIHECHSNFLCMHLKRVLDGIQI